MKKKSAPLIQNAPCERCHGTHVLIEAVPRQRYARGRLCECFPTPCHACSGTGFILRRDRFQRVAQSVVVACSGWNCTTRPECRGVIYIVVCK
ncbi:MAG: hypothetical protein ACO3XK_03775 [bacterium]